jgi:superfamily II DNA or RNA helicase
MYKATTNVGTFYNEETKRTAIKSLYSAIFLELTDFGRFNAFGLEAGVGKTTEAIRIVGENIGRIMATGRYIIFVVPYKADAMHYASEINKLSTIGEVAKGVTGDNWKKVSENIHQLANYPVVIITVARYWMLAKDAHTRKFFEENRQTLIIDEFPELPIVSFSLSSYKTALNCLPCELEPEFHDICQSLFDEITTFDKSNKRMDIVCPKSPIPIEAIKEFQQIALESLKSSDDEEDDDGSYSKARKLISSLHLFYTSECIYSQSNPSILSLYDEESQMWTLKNNIILDANVGIDKRYELNSDMFNINKQPRIFSYDRTTFHQINFHASKNKIKENQDYIPRLCDKILENYKDGDKVLIITRKFYEAKFVKELMKRGIVNIGIGDEYNGENFAVTHNGAILGKNHWRDFNKVWITALHIFPADTYVYYCKFYGKMSLRDTIFKMFGQKSGYRFVDEVIENIRIGCITEHMYQGIKRIDRMVNLDTEVFVACLDERIINLLLEQFPNINIGQTIDLDLDKELEKRTKSEESVQSKFDNAITCKVPGAYSKRSICDEAGIDPKNFSRYKKNSTVIRKLEYNKLIEFSQAEIIILPKASIA